jgi:CRP-like cAMP-binding protein
MEDSEVLAIPHKKFHEVIERQPKWFRSLMQTLSQRLRNANDKIARKVATVREDGSKVDEDDVV